MFYKLLESIKGEKNLSFNHWRYRLLHWTFGISPEYPHESSLPRFLYTHYCPLFHLTNMLAIVSPITLVIRLGISLFLFCFHTTSTALEESAKLSFKVEKTIKKYWPKRVVVQSTAQAETVEPPEKTPEQIASEEAAKKEDLRKKSVLLLISNVRLAAKEEHWDLLENFERFESYYSFGILSQDEAKEIWQKEASRLLAIKQRAEARKENMRQRILFWVNFSQIFIKAFFNIAYFALFAAVAYLSIFYLAPALLWVGKEALQLLWASATVDWIYVLKLAVAIIINIAILFAVVGATSFVLVKLVEKTKEKAPNVFAKAIFPLVAIKDMFKSFFRWVGSGIECTLEFIHMFYEENCPPINIVKDDELATEE